jgi:small subunit ribosomal protein S20
MGLQLAGRSRGSAGQVSADGQPEKIIENSLIQCLTFPVGFVKYSDSKFLKKGDSILANHKSAKKRALQNEVRRLRNRSVKTQIKGIVKNMRAAAAGDDVTQGPEQLKIAQSAIDKAAKKGVLHRKTAARKISRLSRLVTTT